MWVLCVPECFYQRSECGCFVFQNVSTRGVSVGALCFRMFLPGRSVSEWGPVQAGRLLHLYV